ncbi:MAG TPA: hypothetical protein VK920_02675 [Solirubrobacterales bacterium]|jgi:hypothetical protein|nr:hypothetical protein [Solirubrobacterales bacterium]
MRLPPLLSERPRPVQVLLAVVLPAVYGAVTGIFLGISEAVYLVLAIAGLLGAVGAGIEHRGPGAGALRGVLAGAVFGGAILLAHEIAGVEPERELPDPPILLLVITIGFAIPFAALGGWLRVREERKGAVESPREVPGPLG